MKTINQILNFRLITILFATLSIVSCSDDDDGDVEAPDPVEEVEVITNVSLIFTNSNNPLDTVTALAVDPDGEGAQGLQVLNDIMLSANTEYNLTYVILNALDPNDTEDVGLEILEEDDEHQFFYSFTTGAFTSPMGSGNIGDASGSVNYNDEDDNNLPVGLLTSWTTGDASMGTFRARLQHQPPVNGNVVKTATSTYQTGDTDFDVTFDLIIQ